jgi:uncharacterized protein (DUF2147 family)
MDDVTGQAKSLVEITLSENHTLTGRIVKLFQNPDKRCDACAGHKKDQPVLGMVIMEGLKQDPKEPALWTGGMILDPHNGKTYHCQLNLLEEGRVLRLRGYLGVPLFGRSQTWVRVRVVT